MGEMERLFVGLAVMRQGALRLTYRETLTCDPLGVESAVCNAGVGLGRSVLGPCRSRLALRDAHGCLQGAFMEPGSDGTLIPA